MSARIPKTIVAIPFALVLASMMTVLGFVFSGMRQLGGFQEPLSVTCLFPYMLCSYIVAGPIAGWFRRQGMYHDQPYYFIMVVSQFAFYYGLVLVILWLRQKRCKRSS
jgi:hypothetical protein